MSDATMIHQKLAAIQKEINPIPKERTNIKQNYAFRGIDDLYGELHKTFAKHNVFILPEVLEHHKEERVLNGGSTAIYTFVKVKYRFVTDDGSEVHSILLGEAMDHGDKSCNKALSAAQKYALIQMFQIPTGEAHDSENDSPEIASKKAESSDAYQSPNPIREPPMRADDTTEPNYGNYVVDFGKFKNKRLSDIEPKEISSYVTFITNTAKGNGKPITGSAKGFIAAAGYYLATLQQ